MKKLLLIGLSVFAISMPVMAADDLTEKLTLAKEYSKVVSVAQEIKETIDQLAIQVPMDQRVLFRAILEKSIKIDQLEAVSEMALAETFSISELQALVEFYSTAEGQAVKSKMEDYQNRVKPVLEQMIMNAVESMESQTK